MYRAGVEGILGIRREGSFLVVDPCIPSAWPGFEATVKVGSTHYDIRVEAPSHCHRDASPAVLDGLRIQRTEGRVRVPLDGGAHSLLIGVERVPAPGCSSGVGMSGRSKGAVVTPWNRWFRLPPPP